MSKQIKEMAQEICAFCVETCGECDIEVKPCETVMEEAEHLYNAGYRKQSDGKWLTAGMFDDFLKCSSCGDQHPWQTAIEYKYCPNCGAKMKGATDERAD